MPIALSKESKSFQQESQSHTPTPMRRARCSEAKFNSRQERLTFPDTESCYSISYANGTGLPLHKPIDTG